MYIRIVLLSVRLDRSRTSIAGLALVFRLSSPPGRMSAPMAASGTAKLIAAAALTGLTCSQGLLMEASKVNGKYPYSVATVPFFSELVKLFVSAYVLFVNLARNRSATHVTTHWASVLLYPIPSLVYLVHNNVQFYTMSYVDPATYQILGNLKIVTTGILFRFALRRRSTRVQWSNAAPTSE